VALVFMHLFFDHKFHSIIIVIGLLFLGVFIAFTMFDTEFRGRNNDPFKGERPADIKAPWEGTRRDAEIKAKWGQGEKAEGAEKGGHEKGGHGEEKKGEEKKPAEHH
jgi:cytochrome c oxidase subunit 4